MKTPAPKTQLLFREYFESLIVAVLVALALRYFVISAYKIPTGSMVPTLKVGDFIFAYKLPYGIPIPFGSGERWARAFPERGDVVVFRYPGNLNVTYVKRVVGLPGDQIAIRNKKLLVNDRESEYSAVADQVIQDLPGHEDYEVLREVIKETSPGSAQSRGHYVIRNRSETADSFGPVVVPPGQIFVLGDNRDSSDDSRYWGTIPLKNLEGRAVVIWMSFDWFNRWADERYPSVRWDRVFRAVR